MKKFVALLLTLVLTFSLAACGAEGGVKDDEAAGPGSFKIGTLDTGSADATTAPLLNQLKLTVEALGYCDLNWYVCRRNPCCIAELDCSRL